MDQIKHPWILHIDEVQRIKAGVEKYIFSQHKSKNKQKNGNNPSNPSTPLKKSDIVKSKKLKLNRSISLNQSPSLKKSKSKINNHTNQSMMHHKPGEDFMPKGYFLDKDGKIVKIAHFNQVENKEDHQKEKINKKGQLFLKSLKRANTLIQPTNDNQLDITLQNNEKLPQSDPIDQKFKMNKFLSLKKDVIEQQKHEQQIKQKTNKQQITQSKQQQSDFLKNTVFELAKMFGQTVRGKPKQAIILQKPLIQKQKPNIKKAIQQQNNKISNKTNSQDSQSFASFGKGFNSTIQPRKISQYLNLKSQKKQTGVTIQRKRSHTYQQNVSADKQKQKIGVNESQPFKKIKFIQSQSSVQRQKIFNSSLKNSQIKKNNQPYMFKSIQFTQQQGQDLKNKYDILSRKLDILKSKVLKQCKYNTNKQIEQFTPQKNKKNLLNIYNKYSPLKNLKKINHDKQIQYMHEKIQRNRSPNLILQQILRK